MTLQIKTSEALDYERLKQLFDKLETASKEFFGNTELSSGLLDVYSEHHNMSRDIPELICHRVIKNKWIAAELAECLSEVGKAVKAFSELGDVTAEIQRLGEAEKRLDELRAVALKHKNQVIREVASNKKDLEKVTDTYYRLGSLLLGKSATRSSDHSFPFKVTSTLKISLTTSPGVYVFRDKDGSPLYVGQSTSILSRLISHGHRDFYAESETVDIISCSDVAEMAFIESSLIKALDPPHNVLLRRPKPYSQQLRQEFSP